MKIFSLFLAVFFTYSGAFATDTKVVIIDMSKIESDSKIIKKTLEEIKKLEDGYKKKIKEKEDAINKDVEKVRGKAGALSPDQVKKEEARIKKDVENYSKYGQNVQNIIEFIKLKTITELNKCVDNEIQNFASNNKIDMVMSVASVPYVSSKFADITEDIVKNFDKSGCKVKIEDYKKEAESKNK